MWLYSEEEIWKLPAKRRTTRGAWIFRIGILTRSARSTFCAPISRRKRRTACCCLRRYLLPPFGDPTILCQMRLDLVSPGHVRNCLQEGDQTTNLYEMQCMWFELESGRRYVANSLSLTGHDFLSRICGACSFLRRKEYGKALKKFQAIDKVRRITSSIRSQELSRQLTQSCGLSTLPTGLTINSISTPTAYAR